MLCLCLVLKGEAKTVVPTAKAVSDCSTAALSLKQEEARNNWQSGDNPATIASYLDILTCEPSLAVAYECYRFIGGANHRMGQYQEAMHAYRQAESTVMELPPSEQNYLANVHSSKGMIFRIWGDYEQAINSFNASLIHAKDNDTRDSTKNVISALINLAQTYRFKGEPQKAQARFQEALKFARNGYEYYRPYILDGFAEFALENKQYPEALQYYQEAKKGFASMPTAVAQTQGNIAEVYIAMGQNFRAQKALAQAVKMGQEAMNNTRELGKIYLAQGQHFEKLNQFDKALACYQSALAQVLPDIDLIDRLSFKVPAKFPPENVIMDALDGKARVFRQLAQQDPHKYHPLALQHWQWALQCQASLRANYQEHTSKYQLVNETRGLAEPAMEQAWLLWQATKEPEYLKIGFELSERTKASMMLELMRELDLRDFQALPSEERSVWDTLQAQLAEIDRALILASNSSQRKTLGNQRFALKQEIFRLEKDWENRFPAYQAVKNDLTTRSPQEIQAQMQPNQAMISYSIGEAQSYAWVIRKDSMIWTALALNSALNQEIVAFRKGLEIGALDIDQKSFALYQKLLAPLQEHLTGIKHLSIVPDQAMALLPFDALLMKAPKAKQKSFEKPYLVRAFPLSYAFSATLWAEMKGGKTTALNPNILAVAPDFPYTPELLAMAQDPNFDPNRACITPIKNLAEIDSLAKLSDIITLVGEQATREQLLAQLEQYAFVHIATHAMADDLDPSKTFLILWEQGSELKVCEETYPNLTALYMNELLHHRIKAEMVVLAACQTGVGRYHHGEGLASLARSFALAGANSVVASLWSVKDRSTRKMMPRFYQYLKEGDSKDVALQKAKIDLLESGLGDPVHWASFIVMGDPAPVEIPDKSSKAWWALLLLAPLLVIIVRRSRSSKAS